MDKPISEVTLFCGCLLSAILGLAEAIKANNDGSVPDATWKSLHKQQRQP